ncbi:MAG: hypothetical protein PHS41_00265 [Victivallaceae bacterium]|nr:hypothetical protein [Victivallaceae bacterium]
MTSRLFFLLLLAILPALNALEIRKNLNQTVFPYDPRNVTIKSDRKLVENRTLEYHSNRSGRLLKLVPGVSNFTQTLTAAADVPIPPGTLRLKFDVKVEGVGPADLSAIFSGTNEKQEIIVPVIRLTASPWRTYYCEVPANARKFRGIGLKLPGRTNAEYSFGLVEFDSAVRDGKNFWTLRDLDESADHLQQFSGHRVDVQGSDKDNALPLRYFFDRPNVAKIVGILYDGKRKTLANFTLDAREIGDIRQYDLLLPQLPAGHYWIELNRFDGNRHFVDNRLHSYWIAFSPVPKAPLPLLTTFSRIAPHSARPSTTVSEGSKYFIVSADKLAEGERLEGFWRSPEGKIFPAEITQYNLVKNPPVVIRPAVWKLTLRLLRGTEILDGRTLEIYFSGITNRIEDKKENAPPRPVGAFPLVFHEKISVQQPGQKTAAGKWIAGSGNAVWSSAFRWGELEPLEGRIQYPLIDSRLAEARETGTPFELSWYFNGDQLPKFLWYDALLDNQQKFTTRRFSPGSERISSAVARTVRALVLKYRSNPSIRSWNFSSGVRDAWNDDAPRGRIGGFDPSSIAAFRSYLEKNPDAAKEYAAPSATAMPPVIDFQSGNAPGKEILIWSRFRKQLLLGYYETLFEAVRSTDKFRPIVQRLDNGGGSPAELLELFRKYNVTVELTGGENQLSIPMQSLAWQYAVPVRLTATPGILPHRALLELLFFKQLAIGGTRGGISIDLGFDHPVPPDGKAEHGRDLERQKQLEVFRHAAQLAGHLSSLDLGAPVASPVAAGLGSLSLRLAGRSTNWENFAERNVNGFHDLIALASERGNALPFVTESAAPEILDRYRTIVFHPSPDIANADALKLAGYVKRGGKLILFGDFAIRDEKGMPSNTFHALTAAPRKEGETAYGKGKIVVLPATADFRREAGKQLELAGLRPPAVSEDERVLTGFRRNHAGKGYLILYGKNWVGVNPTQEEVGAGKLRARIKVQSQFAPKTRCKLRDVTDPKRTRELPDATAEELAAGILLDVDCGALRILEITPEEPAQVLAAPSK